MSGIPVNLETGIAAALMLFGATTLILRLLGVKRALHRLEVFQIMFGETRGGLLHFLAYNLLPFLAGALILYLNLGR